MKIKRLNPSKDNFEPVTIQITLESIKDIKRLWCTLNISDSAIVTQNLHNSEMTDFDTKKNMGFMLWQEINSIAHEKGIIK